MVFGASTHPVPWTTAFGTSALLSPRGLRMFRLLLCFIFMVHFLAHFYTRVTVEGLRFYLIFLTRWSLCAELLYFCLLIHVTELAQSSVEGHQQKTVTFMVALFTVVQPLSMAVTLLYWLVLFPVWKMCIASSDLECSAPPGYLDIFVHGIDWIICLLSFIVGRIPFSFSNAGWFWLCGVVYVIWTGLHYALQDGTPFPCDEYPQNECPIYEQIDWHPEYRLRTAAIILAVLFIIAPIIAAIYKGIGFCRDRCDRTNLYEQVVH